MLRGIFAPPGITPDQVAYYQELFDKVRTLPEWRDYAVRGALKPTAMSGHAFVEWLERTESFHRMLMREARLSVR